jgi:hypothetical protein
MGYNISDVGGEVTDGVDQWNGTLDLSLSNATTISGDFDVVRLSDGANLGEATNGYSFSALSDPTLGSLAYNTTDGTWTFTVNWSAVIATGSDQVISFTVTGRSGSNSDTDTVNLTLVICVARGTRIDTPRGPVKVERLRPGDLVQTLDGPARPVRWIGSRVVTAEELERDPSLRPVRITAGALGKGAPRRDLVMSPQHRVLLEDWRAQLMFGEAQVLAPAKSLVNDGPIRVDHGMSEVEYFHILFDDHEIIVTEGLATESFHPGTTAMRGLADAVRSELIRLFPELDRADGYGPSARPVLKGWESRVLHSPADQDRRA